jgi:hypothetical protein
MMNKKISQKNFHLPSDFHEVLLKHEIQLNLGNITIDLIRKLLYLYSVKLYKKIRFRWQ